MYIVYSHGRTGSTLLAELLGCYYLTKYKPELAFPGKFRRDQFVLWDSSDIVTPELETYPVIHTHYFKRNTERFIPLMDKRKIFYSVRRSIVETVASSYIADQSDYWQHYTNFRDERRPGQKISHQLTVPHGYVISIVNGLNQMINNYKQGKANGWDAHLMVYEDWIHNFQSIPVENFYYHQELNSLLSKKIPVDKKKLVDYNDLEKKIMRIHGSLELEV